MSCGCCGGGVKYRGTATRVAPGSRRRRFGRNNRVKKPMAPVVQNIEPTKEALAVPDISPATDPSTGHLVSVIKTGAAEIHMLGDTQLAPVTVENCNHVADGKAGK